MLRTVLAVAAITIGVTAVVAQSDPIATRKGLMKNMGAVTKTGGQMAFFFSYGREPWVPKEQFPQENLVPDRTPLADALRVNELAFRTWDLTRQDYALAQRRIQVLPELKPQFESEGALFIYENRMGDAEGISQAVEDVEAESVEAVGRDLPEHAAVREAARRVAGARRRVRRAHRVEARVAGVTAGIVQARDRRRVGGDHDGRRAVSDSLSTTRNLRHPRGAGGPLRCTRKSCGPTPARL